MFNCSSSIDVVPPAVPELLLLGCPGSGKTLLTRQLNRLCQLPLPPDAVSPSTSPTTGVEVERLSRGGRSFTIKEVGGSMQSTWPSYYKAASSVVLCVSASAPHHLSSSLLHLLSILSSPSRSPALLLVVTHVDAACALSASVLESLTRFSDLLKEARANGADASLLRCSPLTGDGCPAVLDRITRMLAVT